MSVDGKYTVWLLGAGFSRALGGPLLEDLFMTRLWGDDREVFPHTAYPALAWDLYLSRLFCERGRKEGRWRNAEDFLAFVDTAHRNAMGPGKPVLRVIGDCVGEQTPFTKYKEPGEFDAFLQARARFLSSPVSVRRALAAECSAFLRDLDGNEEIWHPYRTWASTLEPDRDTVISFNYDCVLEKLAAERGSKLKIMMPSECSEATSGDFVPVLKLHGSVDWRKTEEGKIEHGDFREVLANENVAPFIAAPGRSKQDAVKELCPLWEQACQALTKAWALEIVGYGFPATDTMARTTIQTAFSAGHGPTDAKVRRIDVVLGPDTNRPEARRVHTLLETFHRMGRLVVAPERPIQYDSNVCYLKVHPLLSEDFIFDYQDRTKEPERLHVG